MGDTFRACQNVTFEGVVKERIPDTKITRFYKESREEEVCAEADSALEAAAGLKKVIAGRCSEQKTDFRCNEAKPNGAVAVKRIPSFWERFFEVMATTKFKDPFFM